MLRVLAIESVWRTLVLVAFQLGSSCNIRCRFVVSMVGTQCLAHVFGQLVLLWSSPCITRPLAMAGQIEVMQGSLRQHKRKASLQQKYAPAAAGACMRHFRTRSR